MKMFLFRLLFDVRNECLCVHECIRVCVCVESDRERELSIGVGLVLSVCFVHRHQPVKLLCVFESLCMYI